MKWPLGLLAFLLASTFAIHSNAESCAAQVNFRSESTDELVALGSDPVVAENIRRYAGGFGKKIVSWRGPRPTRLLDIGWKTFRYAPYNPQDSTKNSKPNQFITLYRGLNLNSGPVDFAKAGYWWDEDSDTALGMGARNDPKARVLIFEIQVPLFVVSTDGGYPTITEDEIPDFRPFIRRIGTARAKVFGRNPIKWQAYIW